MTARAGQGAAFAWFPIQGAAPIDLFLTDLLASIGIPAIGDLPRPRRQAIQSLRATRLLHGHNRCDRCLMCVVPKALRCMALLFVQCPNKMSVVTDGYDHMSIGSSPKNTFRYS